VTYCSKKCEKEDFKKHKWFCEIIKHCQVRVNYRLVTMGLSKDCKDMKKVLNICSGSTRTELMRTKQLIWKHLFYIYLECNLPMPLKLALEQHRELLQLRICYRDLSPFFKIADNFDDDPNQATAAKMSTLNNFRLEVSQWLVDASLSLITARPGAYRE